MPTSVPIAMPNPTAASRGPGLLAPTEGIVLDETTTMGFAGLLTALLPQAPQLPNMQPGTVPAGQPAGTSAIPTKPKALATDAAGSRQSKSRPFAKRSSLAVETVMDPTAQTTPPDPLPPLSIRRVDAAIRPSGDQKDAPNRVVARTSTPRTTEPAAVSQNGPETRPSVFVLPAPTADRASPKPDLASAVPQQTTSISESPPVLPTIPVKLPSPGSGTPPAEQLAPVLVSIANTPAGVQHMTLQLRPDALGGLHIQIDRMPNAPTQIRIEVERPETLALLQRDTRQLQHALDQAEVPRQAMTVTFHAAPAVSATSPAQDTGQMSQQFLGTGQPQQGFGNRHPKQEPFQRAEAERQSAAVITGTLSEYPSVSSGIDITA